LTKSTSRKIRWLKASTRHVLSIVVISPNTDLGNVKFIECQFINCNLSLAKLGNTVFREVKFKDCKMLGLHFEKCSQFGLAFTVDSGNLSHCSFYETNLKKIILKNALLHEADFTGCDLTSAVFDNCDLKDATFSNTIIEKADFRTAFNYSIDPTINKIKKAKFSLTGVPGLLDRYDLEIE
jgi:fluoroquinolone resistance protein